MPDWLRRAGRTLLQSAPTGLCVALYQAFARIPLTPEQVAAIMGVGTALTSAAMNLVEEKTGTNVAKYPTATKAHPKA